MDPSERPADSFPTQAPVSRPRSVFQFSRQFYVWMTLCIGALLLTLVGLLLWR